MTRSLRNLATATALLSAACAFTACSSKKLSSTTSGGPGGTPPNPVGATDFVSQPLSAGGGEGGGGGLAEGTLSNGAAAPQTGASGAAAPTRTIQESDLYAVNGNALYVLNTYRGLEIVDITNLTSPNVIARVPIVGTPVGLYAEGNTVYVIVSDYFFYDWIDGFAGGAGWGSMPWVGSQVWAIDVTVPAAPVVLSTLPINGEIDDSCIVGNILYVVSNVWTYYYMWGAPAGGFGNTSEDLTFVASFDISNSQQMNPVAELDFPSDGWNINDNVTDTRIILSESGYDETSGNPITQFAPIDISDPSGKLVLGNLYQASGSVDSRWAMDFDPTSGVFRAIMDQGYGNSGGTLEDWTASTVATATPVGVLNLNIDEAVTAATFNGPMAYLSTANCTDPLWIADTTDPTQPKLDGSLVIPGTLDFIEPLGSTQLLALGHDTSGCNVWEGSGGLAVSLFDVSNPNAPTMQSQVTFGSQYSAVNASTNDMKKAFQVLTNMSPGLILVPFESWDDTSYTYNGGTQLIDLNATSLTLDGMASQQGFVERAFPVQNEIVAFSDQTLQVLDASNRNNPVTVAQIDMARAVLGLTVVNGQVVELAGDYTVGSTELAVTNPTTPDQAIPNAVVSIPAPYAQTFQDGNIMWILSNDYTSNTAWLQGVDLTNPSSPVLRGRLAVNPAQVPNWYGGWYYWGFGDQAVIAGNALAIHLEYYGCYDCGDGYQAPLDQVYVIDLSNPDAPTLAPPVTLPGSDWSWGLTAVGNFAWITHYEWVPSSNYTQVRYYLDRIDLTTPSSPQLLAKINVPGVFFSASTDGQTIYTQDVTYAANWTAPETWLNQLQLQSNGTALLTAATGLSGYAGSAAVNNGYAYIETWNWNSSTNNATLFAVNLSDLTVESSQLFGSDWAWIMASAGGKLFVQSYWYDAGILVYDLTNPGQPTMQGSVRTEGYVENVVVNGSTAYLPSGDYGVPMVDLTPGSALATQP
jgi:hypothetical protein